ncbi:MAG: hypothetical protein OIF48_19880 [Silicimonas sp.]|nr:hypothetical protein [Silicimonas sp.]
MDRPAPHSLRLIDDLLEFGDLKVWSVLATIFGDFAPGEGAVLPGPFLSGLTGRLGIRIEAQRVALHRLRKDGWVDVARRGRVSHYSLSAKARRETAAVQSRVFDAAVARPAQCRLIITAPGETAPPAKGAIAIAPGTWLTTAPPQAVRNGITSEIAIATLPPWARDQAMAPGIQADYTRLHALLMPQIDRPALTAADQITLRILILHRWRRLVLSHRRTAAHLMGPDWVGNHCRARVQALLADLPRPEIPD